MGAFKTSYCWVLILNLIGDIGEGFGQANGYKGAAKLIAKVKDQGIHFVYGMDDAILNRWY